MCVHVGVSVNVQLNVHRDMGMYIYIYTSGGPLLSSSVRNKAHSKKETESKYEITNHSNFIIIDRYTRSFTEIEDRANA